MLVGKGRLGVVVQHMEAGEKLGNWGLYKLTVNEPSEINAAP